MDLYSINYVHFGAPKQWYCIPPDQMSRFESVAKSKFIFKGVEFNITHMRTIGYFPDSSRDCPEFMRHKAFVLSPKLLEKEQVFPRQAIQHAGEFMITFPYGYHAGFNYGFNAAEAVNFALTSWFDIGMKAKYCQCQGDSVHIDMEALKLAYEREELKELRKYDKVGFF